MGLNCKPLRKLFENGKKNNVKSLSILEKHDVDKMEPHTNAIAAIYSPNTGVMDSHSLMKHFLNNAEKKGVLLAFDSEVELIGKEKDGFVIGIKQEKYRFKSQIVINCAGLSSDFIASLAGIDIQKSGYKLKFCKGLIFFLCKTITH
jgi:L-2-hydroxyglutarate oxidase LhgO